VFLLVVLGFRSDGGTTRADYVTRSLGIGYGGGATLLLCAVLVTLALWYWVHGSVSVQTVDTPSVEAFYWATITLSQTLGTALGDWMADDTGLGYLGSALVFGSRTRISHVALFWNAFILTRPLGATLGDFLDRPHDHGGLAFSRPIATAILGP